jgi:hypothetical protein
MNNYRLSLKTLTDWTSLTRRHALVLTVCFSIFALAAHSSYARTENDTRAKQLDDKKRKLDKQKDPEDRTASYMEIAAIKLTYVRDAIAANDLAKLKLCIEEYRQNLRDARDTMIGSGLDSYKNPKGYKTIELATRTHLRVLTDFARRLSLDNRQSLEDTLIEVSTIRGEMLRVLFP